ncbi:MAG: hypothetical protein M1306_02860 [Candidatus Thermoplasmatota archaeon]|jgi:hypothetical protein|nr:hypothetical protein [Candidatus Thermoplasmatota archaeon]
MRTMTTYRFEFCVSCYADKALKDVRDILSENAHSEDVEIVLKPGKPGSYSISKDGETFLPKTNNVGKSSENDDTCCSSCC